MRLGLEVGHELLWMVPVVKGISARCTGGGQRGGGGVRHLGRDSRREAEHSGGSVRGGLGGGAERLGG